jgi:FdhD protein
LLEPCERESDVPQPRSNQVQRRVQRLRDGAWHDHADVVAAEEPMEIRVIWEESGVSTRKSIAITMRTPGDDFELAAGFLFGEGVLRRHDDIVDISYCKEEDEDQRHNIVTVTLRPGLALNVAKLERNFYTTSSCGVCGKATLDALEVQGCSALPGGFAVSAATVCALPAKLREAQAVFETTGGLHAAGLFTSGGALVSLKEDVGRHNATDKLFGGQMLAGATPLRESILLLSGRASFELLQKALVAGVPVVASVGAPSSLAVELADSFNITLAGFVRTGGLNVYAGRERILH